MSHCHFSESLLGIVLLILGLTLPGCKPDSGPGTIHPVEARVPHFDDPDHTIRTESPPKKGRWAQITAAWGTPTYKIGVENAQGPELFGRISDVEQDNRGRIFVVDYENKEVRVFSPEGAHRFTFGRAGEGPGEFQYPSQLELLDDGTLMVAGRSGRVQFFEVLADSVNRTGGFTVDFTPEDVCVLGDEVFIHGAPSSRPEHSIHVYSRPGKHARSFGPVYQSDNEFIRRSITDGHITCDEPTNTVVFGFGLAPILYGYRSKGTFQWTARIRPFDPMPAEQRVSDAGTPSIRYKSVPHTDRLSGLTDMPGPSVLVQRVQYPPDEVDRADVPIFSYSVSARDGTGGYVGKSTIGGTATGPITHVSTTNLLSAKREPFPKIDAYDLESIEWAVEQ